MTVWQGNCETVIYRTRQWIRPDSLPSLFRTWTSLKVCFSNQNTFYFINTLFRIMKTSKNINQIEHKKFQAKILFDLRQIIRPIDKFNAHLIFALYSSRDYLAILEGGYCQNTPSQLKNSQNTSCGRSRWSPEVSFTYNWARSTK